MAGKRTQWVPVRKVRTADACYAVINDAWHSAPDIARLVASVCSCQKGIGADGLVRIKHHGRARFDLEAFDSSGNPVRASVSALACCAIAIRDEYGYQCAQLREDGVVSAVRITADRVELRTDGHNWPVRPGVTIPMTNRAWLVAKSDFAVTSRAAAAMSWQSPATQIRTWAGEEQWLPLSRAC